MILLKPLLLPLLLGFLTARLLLQKAGLRNFFLLVTALSFPLGLVLCTLILFWCYVFAGGAGKSLTPLAASAVLAILLVFNLRNQLIQDFKILPAKIRDFLKSLGIFFSPQGRKPVEIIHNYLTLAAFFIFLYCLYHYIDYYTGKVTWNIFGGWDARYFWNLKAKFYFRDPNQWRSMFTPILPWAHPDYPLMLPGVLAWGWILAGKEFLLWAPVVDFIFFISLCLLALWYLGTYTSWRSGFLAVSFMTTVSMFRFWSTVQYADIPLGWTYAASVLFLILGLSLKDKRLFLFSGLMAGLSAWTKNEGLFFCGWLLLTLSVLFSLRKDFTWEEKKKILIFWGLGTLVGLSAAIYAKVFLGLKGGEYLGSGRTVSQYFQALFGNFKKTQFIASCFALFKLMQDQWTGLWVLFFAALLTGGGRIFRNYRWILPLSVFLVELGYFVVLHLAPAEIKFQISVSLLRLMLHTAGLALIFAFEIMEPKPAAESA